MYMQVVSKGLLLLQYLSLLFSDCVLAVSLPSILTVRTICMCVCCSDIHVICLTQWKHHLSEAEKKVTSARKEKEEAERRHKSEVAVSKHSTTSCTHSMH